MQDLIVDLTPICVNRTAIYHIALDTFRALGGEAVGFQFRGERRSMPVDRAEEQEIAGAFFQDVATWAAASPHVDEIDLTPPASDNTAFRLYFDPIYTLYRPLQKRDIVFILDLSTLTNPEWHSPGVAVTYERAFRKLMGSPARIISISEHCTALLRTSFSIPEADIVTVPLYLRDISTGQIGSPYERLTPRKFFLFVGSLEMRKNPIGLLRAFAMTGLASEGWHLALAGGKGLGWEAITVAAEELDGVELLGFVSDDELSWLYANAAVFAYPSFLEGFGLPLLEAMAHGLPCLTSITGASREVCGDLGIMVDPYETQTIVDGLLRCAAISRDVPNADRDDLIARSRTFTFDRYFSKLQEAFI